MTAGASPAPRPAPRQAAAPAPGRHGAAPGPHGAAPGPHGGDGAALAAAPSVEPAPRPAPAPGVAPDPRQAPAPGPHGAALAAAPGVELDPRQAPAPGRHGGDGAALAAALGVEPAAVLDLSASLNPVAPDPAEIVGKHLDALGRYPDPSGATAALAEAMGVAGERLLLTNGGAEAIALVASVLGGGVAAEPEFSLHPRWPDGPRWRSNPHNPTGLLSAWDPDVGVWDEAFYPLATGRWTAGWPGVVVGSLTKVFACPGLRLGYVLADPETIERVGRAQPEWAVNGLAVAALPDLLSIVDLSQWSSDIKDLRRQLLSILKDFDPQPSDANYVLCRKAAGLRDRLARRGVLVRDCSSFGLPDAVRVAVPDGRGLQRLEEALCAAA